MLKIFILTILLFSTTIIAREVPKLTGPVMDEAGILNTKNKSKLEKTLRNFKQKTGNQIQLYIIKSLEDEYLEGYSMKVVEQWKLGSEKNDNGVLFLIALKERKMRIEVGQGLEGTLTDAAAGRIISKVRPFFKSALYQLGIKKGVERIILCINDEIWDEDGSMSGLILPCLIWFFIFVFGFSFYFVNSPSKKGKNSNKSWWEWNSSNKHKGGHWGGGTGGWGGGTGGGGWGGGGGGFSGGGASGGW